MPELANQESPSRLQLERASNRTGRGFERERSIERARGMLSHIVDVGPVVQGQRLTVEKIVALHTSRDSAISAAEEDARERVQRARAFDALLVRHELAWDALWRLFDIELEYSDDTQLVLRLHAFHVLQTLSPNTYGLDVGVPARGLHGEAYRGHVFWDELFIRQTAQPARSVSEIAKSRGRPST